MNHSQKYHLHGVTRLLNSGQVRKYAQETEAVKCYIITTESRGTKNEHVHFYFSSDSKELNKFRTKNRMKEMFKINPKINGELNIDKKVKDPLQTIIYLTKEGYPQYIHGFTQDFIKECSRKSYNKDVTMTTAIKHLKDELVKCQIDIVEYIVKYRTTRIKYRKPDPLWRTEYNRAEEILKSYETIKDECLEYHTDYNRYK